MKTARKRYCTKCGTKQHGEKDDTPRTNLLAIRGVVLFLFGLILASIAACWMIIVVVKGYDAQPPTYRMVWWMTVWGVFGMVWSISVAVWAYFRIREGRKNPFRCNVCGTALE